MKPKTGLKREAVKNKNIVLNTDRNDRYYKGASTNENRGYATHGSFVPKNGINKTGAKGKSRMEGQTEHVTKKLRKLARGLFKTKQGDPMHAQPNA